MLSLCMSCSFTYFNPRMRYPLPCRANELLAMSKLRLRAAVGLLTGHTSLRAHLYNLDTQDDKNAGCVDVIKKTVYILCVTVLS
jgi:hypothetical protein